MAVLSSVLWHSSDTVVMGTCEALAAVGEKLPDSLRTGVWRILDRISADGYTDFRDHDLPVRFAPASLVVCVCVPTTFVRPLRQVGVGCFVFCMVRQIRLTLNIQSYC